MSEPIKLYTSLPPNVSRTMSGREVGAAYLGECIRSWRRGGFDVVSINGANEIDSLTRQGYEVDYRSVPHDRPAISDFLAAIRGSQASVAGIINADVLLMAEPELLRTVVDTRGLTLMERININPDSLRPVGRSCYGFDAFVFATAPLSRIAQGEEFLFGHPWWDYWFPFAYLAAGGQLRLVKAPVLFHLQHQLKWKHSHFVQNARNTVRCLRGLSGLPDDANREIRNYGDPAAMSEAQLSRFGSWCFDKLKAMAEPIGMRPVPTDSSPLGTLVRLLSDSTNRAWLGELDDAEGRVLIVAETLSRKAVLLQFWSLNLRALERRFEMFLAGQMRLLNPLKAAAAAFAAMAQRARSIALGSKPGLPR